MSTINRHRTRGKEILGILKNHGALNIEVIQKMTEPPMKSKKLRRSMSILRHKGFVETKRVSRNVIFYHLSQSLTHREKVADLIKCQPQDLVQPLIRGQDYIHNGWCEYWIHQIKKLYPQAEIVREVVIPTHKLAKTKLAPARMMTDLLPDFLLLLKTGSGSETVSIAFEIERTRKSDARILQKLRRYSDATRIDGLVYICDSGRLSETIRQLYQTKTAPSLQRISNYVDNFCLFSDAMESSDEPLQRIYNSKAQSVSLAHWCEQLVKTKLDFRRENQFV